MCSVMTSFHASLVVACIVAVSFVGCASPPPGSSDAGASGPSAGPGPRFSAGGPDAREYGADPKRIFLMGNSSGGSAVWTYATHYPGRWAAIAPSAAPLDDAAFPYETLKSVPVLVIHGDMDTTMVFDASKTMVDHARAKGVDATWLPVAGGLHTDAWAQPEIITKIFDFFDAHPRK